MLREARTCFLLLVLLTQSCARAEAPPPPPEVAASAQQGAKADTKSSSLDNRVRREAGHRIIRSAEVSLEANDQLATEGKIIAAAERFGGFSVSSERHESNDIHGTQSFAVEITVRVPSEKFEEFLGQTRAAAERVGSETTTGQDVTEEFIDLEARVVTERALESQYLEIMKQSKSVKDALEVHEHLADVRERIEKAEGRKHFLENQTAFSTVHITISKFVPELRAQGFGVVTSIRSAAHDVTEVGAYIVIGLIRVLGVLLPIGLILGGPVGAVVWFARARARRNRARILAASAVD